MTMDVAIVGMACRFPEADDPFEFGLNLRNGRHSVSEIGADRWNVGDFYGADRSAANKTASKWCGQLRSLNEFDYDFFNISPAEAEALDPQQRLLLEETCHCIEDSAIHPSLLRDGITSVHVGAMATDFMLRVGQLDTPTSRYACVGNYPCILSNRLSYVFGFRGLSLTLDAACASSLVAVHEAVRQLVTGQCDHAIAAGVSLNLHPWKYIAFSKSHMLSADGRCKTFDASADGYVPGDGVGVILLKRLDDALRDRNNIRGIIKGSAVNHGGHGRTMTEPQLAAQRDVVLAAYRDAGISPATVSYVEAHGTGTILGDPIEVQALAQAFAEFGTGRGYCKIGSVKSNIGHLEAAAGIAGLIKVLLMIEQRCIFKTLHVHIPNPIIEFGLTPFVLALENAEWTPPQPNMPLRAGISSFGMGGVNSHILIEEPPSPADAPDDRSFEAEPQLFLLSAKSEWSLDRMLRSWAAFLKTPRFAVSNFSDACATLMFGREAYAYRFGVKIADPAELAAVLASAQSHPATAPGAWYLQIADCAFEGFAPFAAAFRSNALFRHELLAAAAEFEIGQREITDEHWASLNRKTHSCLMLHGYLRSLMRLGLRIDGVCASGGGFLQALLLLKVVDLHDACSLIRGDAMLSELTLRRPVAPLWDSSVCRFIRPPTAQKIDLAALLGDLVVPQSRLDVYRDKARLLRKHQVTFAKYLAEWEQLFRSRGIDLADFIENPDAYGRLGAVWLDPSAMACVVIASSLTRLQKRSGLRSEISAVDDPLGEIAGLVAEGILPPETLLDFFIKGSECLPDLAGRRNEIAGRADAENAWRFVASGDAISGIQDLKCWFDHQVNLPTAPVLPDHARLLRIGNIPDALQPQPPVANTLNADPTNHIDLLLALWNKGENLPWREIFEERLPYRKVSLPTTRFVPRQIRSTPLPIAPAANATDKRAYPPPAGRARADNRAPDDARQALPVTLDPSNPVIRDHVIGGEALLAAAASLEMIHAAAAASAGTPHVSIHRVVWAEPLKIDAPKEIVLLESDAEHSSLILRESGPGAARLVEARLGAPPVVPSSTRALHPDRLDFDRARESTLTRVSSNDIYDFFARCGYSYGPTFRTIKELFRGQGFAIAHLESLLAENGPHTSHLNPTLIDGAIQAAIAHTEIDRGAAGSIFMPFEMAEFAVLGPVCDECYAYITSVKEHDSSVSIRRYDITCYGKRGEISARLRGLAIKQVTRRTPDAETSAAIAARDGPSVSTPAIGLGCFESFRDYFVRAVETVIGCGEGDVDAEGNIADYGMDSVSFVDVANALNEKLGLALGPAIFFEHSTFSEIADRVWKQHPHLLQAFAPTQPCGTGRLAPAASGAAGVEARCSAGCKMSRSANPRQEVDEPIAIIGMAAILPQSRDLAEFWRHLHAGRDLITEIPPDRWRWQEHYGDAASEPEQDAPRWGGFMPDVDKFDAPFFNISARAAASMDPQQRLLMQTVWKAIEHAGYDPKILAGAKVAVFVGAAFNDYDELIRTRAGAVEPHSATGIANSILSNRISHFFDFRGPSETIDTACSSSLVAVHRAVRALRSGESELAIAGGVHVIASATTFIALSKAGMLSPTGRSRAFDHRADGYVRGEGIGALLLKPLSKAQHDGDFIHGLVLGSAASHGGQTNTLTTPSPRAQADLIRQSCADAGVEAGTLSYVEAHGTGTPLGDPIEIAALKEVFCENGDDNVRCGIGSVKTNIGHLEAASGIAGILKVVLAMQHRKLPAHVNFQRLSPYISFDGTPFYIVDHNTDWEQPIHRGRAIPRRAGVSSFGFGGTNGHVVLEEFEPRRPDSIHQIPRLFVFSASDRERLQDYCRCWLEFIGQILASRAPDHYPALLRDIAYTLQVGRTLMRERLAVVAADFHQLQADLQCYLDGGESKTLFRSSGSAERTLAMLFRGKSGEELLRLICRRGELEQLAALFVSGADLDFQSLQHDDAHRIPLPTYPFARERHWIDEPLHPAAPTGALRPQQDSTEPAPSFIAKWIPSDRADPRPEASTPRPASTVCIAGSTDAPELRAVLESRHRGDLVIAAADPTSRVENGQRPNIVYFVTGQEQSASGLPPDERDVFALLRLVKALTAFDWMNDRCQLTIISWNAHKCDGDLLCSPNAACVTGFAKGLGKDLPWLDVACVDLDAGSWFTAPASASDKAALLKQLSSATSRGPLSVEVAIRDGVCLERKLYPLTLGEPIRRLFKVRGTYLLLGGMGNLGFRTARHLARNYRANVVLAGRTELTEIGSRKLEELAALGGYAIYVQADVRNASDVCRAVDAAKTRFGRLDGVVHSAMVYDECPVTSLSESGMCCVLDPKVEGSIALRTALANEALDFLLIYSSAQVFTATAARCHYTAACSFQDAFTQSFAARLAFPVKVINWGFWSSVPNHSGRAVTMAAGVRILTERRGLAILDYLDDGPLGQVVVFDVAPEVQELMGVDDRTRFIARACSYGSYIRPAEQKFRRLRTSTGAVKRTPAFDRWIAQNVLRVFRRLGVFVRPAESCSLAGLVAETRVSGKYRRLVDCLLDIVHDAGLVTVSGDVVRAAADAEGGWDEIDGDVLNALKRELIDAQPLAQVFTDFLDRCFASYPAVLRGEIAATEVLFPGGTTACVETIYKDNPTAAADNAAVATLVRDYVEARLQAAGRDSKPVRILEIGAGTGATSASVLAALQQYGDSVTYTYSDISASFINLGRQKFEAKYRFVDYRQIDIEVDTDGLGPYDLIIAANVIHTTRRIRNTMWRLKSLLRTFGWLVLLEAGEATPFTTVTFGLLDGWWHFEDADHRLPNSPLLSADSWLRLLKEVGFASAKLTEQNDVEAGRPIFSQTILIAESDGIVRDRPLSPPVGPAQTVAGTGGTFNSSAVPMTLQDGPAYDARQRVRQQITAALMQVLRVRETIDPAIEFQRIGLDSILGVELIKDLSRSFGIELKLAVLFERSTVESLTDYLLERVRKPPGQTSPDTSRSLPSSSRVERQAALPLPAVLAEESGGEVADAEFSLSAAQTALWLSYKLAPERCAYNVPVVFRLTDGTDAVLLRQAWRAVCMRHAALRVVLKQGVESVEQAAVPYREDSFEQIDYAGPQNGAIDSIVTALSQRPFRLEQGPLARIALITGPFGPTHLVLIIHHIVCDGVSLRSIIEDLTEIYLGLARGEAPALAPGGAGYDDFVAWQRAMLAGTHGQKDRAYWRAELARPLPAIELPRRASAADPSVTGELFSVNIDAGLRGAVEQLGAARNVTVNTVLLAVFFLLLHRRTGQDEIAIGMPVRGRPEPRFERTVGLFANMAVVALGILHDDTFADLLVRTWQKILGAIEHGHYPYFHLLQDLRHSDDAVSARQLFHAGFYFQSELAAVGDGNPLFAERLLHFDQAGEFDLVLDVVPAANHFVVNIKFNPELYERSAIARLASHYTTLVAQVVRQPDDLLRQYSLMSPQEEQKVLELGRGVDVLVSPRETLYQLFEAQVRKTPEAVAVVHGGARFTYRELEERADRCARVLRNAGIAPGMTAAIYVEHGPELLIALLGLLKAGVIYVPLDASYPRERLLYMIENAAAAAIVTRRSADLSWLPDGSKAVFMEGDPGPEGPLTPSKQPASDLAYIIYTSGSTGQPKGVLTPHRGVVNFLHGMIRELGFDRTDRTFWITSICFDPSVLEIYLPLVVGGTVEIPAVDSLRDGIALARALDRAAATVIQATPATYQMLLAAGWGGKPGAKILCGGEAMTPELAAELLKRGDALWNVFGPTEATVWNAVGRVHTGQPITIGKPIQNIHYFALDEMQRPVPIGVVGELHISGAGLAAGYQLQDEATQKSFLANPFSSTKSSRLYKSGDLVRLREDGRFEYVGRTDNQVKLRGCRIELGGVEEALKRNPAVAAAAVVVRKDSEGHSHLHAFVTPRSSGQELTTDGVNAALRSLLPAYMLPSRVHVIDEMPLTPTRKIDRKLLAHAALDDVANRHSTMAERTSERARRHGEPLQHELTRLVASMLNMDRDQVQHDRHLGEYGFDSIRYTGLSALLHSTFGIDIKPTVFYDYNTIRAIASYLKDNHSAAVAQLKGPTRTAGAPIVAHPSSTAASTAARQAQNQEPVAVIGVAGRFPQSEDVRELWAHLVAGRDLISEIPSERRGNCPGWRDHQGQNQLLSLRGGFAPHVDKFDAAFFGISPREAELMDPQHRLFLETAWHVIEDAGYRISDMAGTATAVLVGTGSFDYWQLQHEAGQQPDNYTLTGLSHGAIANRVSFLFDLKGPSAAVDTACSSSLVAVHRAAKMIQACECEMAIAGGVNLILSRFLTDAAGKAGMMSPAGRCKTFDASADGYVRGEGVGAVLLKSLAAAQRDGDNVYAVIRGSAENHSGRTSSFTAPSSASQAELLARAYRNAGVDPSTVTYVEAHGTGTALGDPIEIKALSEVLGRRHGLGDDPPRCGVGSIKTNIGHLEVAAGIAGLIKVLLALKCRMIPGILHHAETNPYIELSGTRLYIATAAQTWDPAIKDHDSFLPRRAGISSFGFGGANAHVVVEEYIAPNRQDSLVAMPRILALSAKTREALSASVRRLSHFLASWSDDAQRNVGQELPRMMAEILGCKNAEADGEELWAELRTDAHALARFAHRAAELLHVNLTVEDLLLKALSFSTLVRLLHSSQAQRFLADVAYTLAVGRESFDHRVAIIARNLDEAARALGALDDGGLVQDAEAIAAEVRDQHILREWLSGGSVDWRPLYVGEHCRRVSLPGYCFARVRHWISNQQRVRTASSSADTTDAAPRCYWRPEWNARELTSLPCSPPIGPYVVLADGGELAKRLRQRGAKAIDVRSGAAFQICGEDTIEIDTSSAEGFAKLAEYLRSECPLPRRLIHAPSGSENSGALEASVDRIVTSSFRLARAMSSFDLSQLDWLHVYERSGGRTDALHSAIGSFGRTLRQENRLWTFKCVELAEGHSIGEADDFERLLSEFDFGKDDCEVRYAGGVRYVRDLRPLELSREAASPLRRSGTYLITGGSGAIGRIVARHLAETWDARVILCGRSRLKESTSFPYIRADVTDAEQVRSLVSAIKQQFGGLDGVFHAAGIIRDGAIERKTDEQVRAVLAPKVAGIVNLDLATRDQDLACFVMFSSLAALVGNPGQSDYATANGFMDEFARYRHDLVGAGARRGATLSINFPLWRDGGMRVTADRAVTIELTAGTSAIEREIGLAMLDEALRAGTPQVIAAAGTRSRIEPVLKYGWPVDTADATALGSAQNFTPGALSYKTNTRQSASVLQRIMADVLKMAPQDIDLNKPMRDYGLDSLSIIDFAAQVSKHFEIEIPAAALYENPTIASLAERLPRHDRDTAPGVIAAAPDPSEAPGRIAGAPQAPNAVSEPIAIIGMSCVFPGSPDVQSFWNNLVAGCDLTGPYPPQRRLSTWVSDEHPLTGGFMPDVEKFDAAFFGISAEEARLMDPQHRIFLQVAWHAIESAGYKISDLSGSDTGLFVGVASADYRDVLRDGDVEISEYTASGISHCVLANRISYLMNLHGPSEPVDTGCSSALVAIHRGVAALRRGECGLVLAGGINVILSSFGDRLFDAAGVISKSGSCRPFDARADGYVRGEGAAALVLKRLRDAERERDTVWAVIRGSAQNHGGQSNGLTAPNPKAQADVISKALRDADVAPNTVSYIEGHGTGTLLGDSVELRGLLEVFGASAGAGETGYCYLGSVKGNIGHLEAASGVASVVKVVLALQHQMLPASIHFDELNPFVRTQQNPFRVVRETIRWPRRYDQEKPLRLRAGISSFGFGGTNAHLVLEEYEQPVESRTFLPVAQAFVLSAKSSPCLLQYASDFLSFLAKPNNGSATCDSAFLADMAFTLQIGREERPWRLAVVVSDLDELVSKIRAFIEDPSTRPPGLFVGDGRTILAALEPGGGTISCNMTTARHADLCLAAAAWVNGASADWRSWHDPSRRRIPLPVCAFEETPCRIESPARASRSRSRAITIGKIHPLLHANLSTQRTNRFASVFTADDPLLRDHVILGRKLMPGAALLEMARAGAAYGAEREIVKIRKIVWQRRVALGEDQSELAVELCIQRSSFELLSADPGKPLAVCASGELEFQNDEGERHPSERIDLDAVTARCRTRISGDEFYARLAQSGFSYGRSFRVIQSLRRGQGEALAFVEVPDGASDPGLLLHPAVLDAALQTVHGTVPGPKLDDAPVVPFAIAELTIASKLPRRCFVHAETTQSHAARLSPTLTTWNLAVIAETGELALKISRYATRAWADQARVSTASADGASEQSARVLLTRLHNGELTPQDAGSIYRSMLRPNGVELPKAAWPHAASALASKEERRPSQE